MSQSWGTASVRIPPDDDGMVGCQCPQESCRPRYFKISSPSAATASSAESTDDEIDAETQGAPREEIEDASPAFNLEESGASDTSELDQNDIEGAHVEEERGEVDAINSGDLLYCPYCGHTAHRQRFFTPEQLDYAKSLILRHIMGMFQQQLKQLERRPDPHAFLSIGVTVKTSALPEIATYEERHLKQEVTCPHCQARYAVYGVSYTCPRCGADTLLWHLESSAREIRVFLELPDDILARLDARSQEKLIENALEDVVSFWEGYLKALYRHAVRRRYDAEMAAQLERQIGTTFQRLQGATERFAKDLGIDLLADVTPNDVALLTRVFNKRHVLSHNLGLADEKFLAQTQMAQQVGQEIDVTREETLHALDIVSKVLQRADEQTRFTTSGT